jgi:hypothetical protein
MSSDDSHPSLLSLSLSEVEDMFYANTQAELDRLREDILTSRVLRDTPKVKKAPQISSSITGARVTWISIDARFALTLARSTA